MDEETTSCTRILLNGYCLIFTIGSIFGILLHIFAQLEPYIYATTGWLFLTVIFGLLTVGFVKWLVEVLHDKVCQSKGFKRDHIDFVIGYSIIILLGYAPRILIFFIDPSYFKYIYLYSCFVYPLVSLGTYAMFLIKLDFVYVLDWEKKAAVVATMCCISAVLVFLALIGAEKLLDKEYAGRVFIYQFFFGMIGINTDVEFSLVLAGGFMLNNEHRQRTVWAQEPAEPVVAPVDSRLECKICLLPYSTTRTPQILRQCGHTVCEGCVTRTLDQNTVHCPLCQVVTVVKGPTSVLAKNHVVLEYIEEAN